MSDLMSRPEYDNRIARELREAFPWTRSSILAPAPGHIGQVVALMRALEEIVSPAVLGSRLDFLRIDRRSDGGLLTYVSIKRLDAERRTAIADIQAAIRSGAEQICSACGTLVQSGRQFCREHAKLRILFAEQLAELQKSTPTTEEDDVLDAFSFATGDGIEAPTKPNAVAAEEVEYSTHEGPTATLFDIADIAKVEDYAKGRERSDRERLNVLAKSLRKAGAVRPLATVPEDWPALVEQLHEGFPNFSAVIDKIADHLALSSLGDRRLHLPPILLDGEPGIGKTEFVLRLAQNFGTTMRMINMATAQTAGALSGSDKHWSNTDTGELFQQLTSGPTANPIVLLDEMDKVMREGRYNPDAALFELLEPRTACAFRDLSLPQLTLDASHVLWMATSNKVENLLPPIRSRFTVFSIPAPTQEQMIGIARAIYQKIRKAAPWGTQFPEVIANGVAERLASLPPRRVGKALQDAFAHAARAGRREVTLADVISDVDEVPKIRGIGFIHSGTGRSGSTARPMV